jgi:hypothetical protein
MTAGAALIVAPFGKFGFRVQRRQDDRLAP